MEPTPSRANPGPTDPGPVRHRPHLDALRGVAALLVVFHHARLECPPAGALARATAWLGEGHFLVTFFIILSGYCLALPTLATGRIRGGLGGFLVRRGRRLLPAYYAALALSIALVATLIGHPTGRHWDFALPVTREAVVTHLLLIHNHDIGQILKINHVFWSIAVEWQIYFSFPVLLWIGRRVGPWATTALALAAGYAGYALVGGTPRFGLMPHYYGMFALGMLAAGLTGGGGRKSAWWAVAGLALVALGIFYRGQTYEVLDLPFGVACASALVALSRAGRARAGLEWSPLVALGGFSYSLYLVHAPLQHLLVEYGFGRAGLPRPWEFPALVVVGTPLILAASFGFARAFERPFLASGSPAATAGGPRRARAGEPVRTGRR